MKWKGNATSGRLAAYNVLWHQSCFKNKVELPKNPPAHFNQLYYELIKPNVCYCLDSQTENSDSEGQK